MLGAPFSVLPSLISFTASCAAWSFLYAVDRKVAAFVLDEAELHWPGVLRLRGHREAAEIGWQSDASRNAGGCDAFDHGATIRRWHY